MLAAPSVSERPVISAKVRAPRADALRRERLESRLAQIWSHRLGLIVAPAGSGKSTLASAFAATARFPVAWYRAETWDGEAVTFCRHLEAALAGPLGALPGPWNSIEDVARGLDAWRGERALLVIDDLHSIEGTPAEQALGRLLDYAPPSLAVLAASRTQPALNLPRLRVSGGLLEIGGDDLRFRSWEVEQLFRDHYSEPLPPVELAELARRTEGWAAGLQLFHLAIQGKAPDERRRLLAGLGGSSSLVSEYLTSNVLHELSHDLRSFLIETSVLGRLSGPICDKFLERHDSQQLLAELERRQIFTQALGDNEHRYHEVLRSHLEAVLADTRGESQLRQRFGRAGTVLEGVGALPDALHAYCRAEDWPAVGRLLGSNGEKLVQRSGAWVDALPASVLDNDAWLLLARARRLRAAGSWRSAIDSYQRAERIFGPTQTAGLARRERQSLAAWLEPGLVQPGDLLRLLRAVTQRGAPILADRRSTLNVAPEALAAGLAALMLGDLRAAKRALGWAWADPEATAALAIAAQLGLGVVDLLAGESAGTVQVAAAIEAAERDEIHFLARLGQACLALGGSGVADLASTARSTSQRLGDTWGAALAGLLEGIACLRADAGPAPVELAGRLREDADWFEHMNAPVLEAWGRALLGCVLAQRGDAGAAAVALRAERLANARGVEGARVFAYRALAAVEPSRRSQYSALAAAAQSATGLAGPVRAEGSRQPRLEIRLFGGFDIRVDGTSQDLFGLKPKARTLLRLLAAQAGRPMHREAIQAALWPEADADAGARNLHVAVSSLRQALEPGVARAGFSLLVRDGEAYRLALGSRATCELASLELEMATGRQARVRADMEGAAACYRRALELLVGELLPEDGAAEWVLEPRERCRADGVEAAQFLGDRMFEHGDMEGVAWACAAGLRVDRYHDPLWRLLIAARERAGDLGAARRARADYEGVLVELGLTRT
jgi:DNA-binding SARP family transcriptional activator